jgi:glycosyltransferase involved in cell wall biosynthesis
MFEPKISIIIPVYNGSNYLAEAIDSALAQTYKNIEILVINDGSPDNWETEKIAKSYWKKIKYFYKKNWWAGDALNFGIKKMTWDYFSWLSHDDFYFKNKVKEQVDFLKQQKEKKVIIFSNISICDGDWKIIQKKWIDLSDINSNNLLYKLFLNHPINWCSLLIPKIVFDTVWLFDIKLKAVQDYHMWFRMINKYPFIKHDKELIVSRWHAWQDSRDPTKFINMMQEEIFVFWNALSTFWFKKIYKSSSENLFHFTYHFIIKFYLRMFIIMRIFCYIWKSPLWKTLIHYLR